MTKAEDNPYPYVTLVEQASAPATPASGKAKIWRGTDNKNYMLDDGGASTELGGTGGGGAGGILAYKAYAPGTLAAYTTTATTDADVDATNLAVTFTAPSSGRVLVRLSALTGINSATYQLMWGLREATTSLVASQVNGFADANKNVFLSVPMVITGLTAGSSHTYKWSWYATGASSTGRLYAGGVAGAAVMEVAALP